MQVVLINAECSFFFNFVLKIVSLRHWTRTRPAGRYTRVQAPGGTRSRRVRTGTKYQTAKLTGVTDIKLKLKYLLQN